VTTIIITGEPQAKGRPRISSFGGKARAYTPAATRKAEERVAAVWRDCGLPMVHAKVPLEIIVEANHERPKTHYLKSGELSSEGRRSMRPTKRPDLDNIVKLVLDGLNGVAYHDDAQIVAIHASRHWATKGSTYVTIRAASDPDC